MTLPKDPQKRAEYLTKLSEAHKKAWADGKYTDARNHKISIASSKPRPWQKNRMTPEVKAKVSAGLKGVVHSPESILKRAETNKANYEKRGRKQELKKAIRKTGEYTSWRTSVFERDDFTCQECGERGGKLNADHIKTFSSLLRKHGVNNIKQARICEDLWDLANGRTLCEPCHYETDTYGFKASIIN